MQDIVIESTRLVFRRIHQGDYNEIAAILQDMDVMYAWEKSFSDKEVKGWIDENLKRYDNEGYSYFLALNKENNEVIGVMGPLVEKIKDELFLGVAYILNKRSWGRGYAVEGVKACIDYAFNNLKTTKVIAHIRTNNLKSISVAEKLNMSKVDKFIKIYDGKEMEHLIYSIDIEN